MGKEGIHEGKYKVLRGIQPHLVLGGQAPNAALVALTAQE